MVYVTPVSLTLELDMVMDFDEMAPAEARPEKNIGNKATTITAAMVVQSALYKPDLLNLNC